MCARWSHVEALRESSRLHFRHHIRGDENGDANFTDFRDGPMCCAVTYVTYRNKDFCRICKDKGRNASHELVERRYRCKSPECNAQWAVDCELHERCLVDLDEGEGEIESEEDADIASPCAVIWKVQHCTEHSEWVPRVNHEAHLRGAIPCSVGTTKLTPEMKKYAAREDDIGIPPRLILVNMKTAPGIREPRRGWPTAMQLTNALKTLRRTQGKKNSIKAIQEYVRASAFYVGIPANELFIFGASQDSDGFAHVGSGDPEDPFLLGVTSVRMVDDCLNFMAAGQFVMFHADATFKLSDLGYPVISCGFTDKKRSYQVAALFVVSRRTAADYAQCFGALARLFKEVRGRAIHVDGIMGDAEDAQAIAYTSIPEFARAKVLMCYFHVLYNVRKKVKHLTTGQRKLVFQGIMDMHFAENMAEFESTRNATLVKWRSKLPLQGFTKYFEQQWLTGRFWRWQAFHSPSGYATTNNPCEVYNSSLKSFFQRRRWHMKKLLEKLRQHLSVQPAVEPVDNAYVAMPTTDLLDAASLLIQGHRVSVQNTLSPACVRVCHVKRQVLQSTEEEASASESDSEEFAQLFEISNPEEGESGDEETHAVADQASLTVVSEDEWKHNVRREREHEKASKLYSYAVKWSLRRSHEQGMPADGWVVDVDRCICSCKFFMKFATCAHVVVGRSARNMAKPGVVHDKKLKSMILSKKARVQKRAQSAKTKAKSAAKAKGKAKAKKKTSQMTAQPLVTAPPASTSLALGFPGHQGIQTLGQVLLQDNSRPAVDVARGSSLFATRLPRLFAPTSQAPAIVGRPPLSSSALEIQFIMN